MSTEHLQFVPEQQEERVQAPVSFHCFFIKGVLNIGGTNMAA
jgi:hypothetical protein